MKMFETHKVVFSLNTLLIFYYFATMGPISVYYPAFVFYKNRNNILYQPLKYFPTYIDQIASRDSCRTLIDRNDVFKLDTSVRSLHCLYRYYVWFKLFYIYSESILNFNLYYSFESQHKML